jgi:hypothetical protein
MQQHELRHIRFPQHDGSRPAETAYQRRIVGNSFRLEPADADGRRCATEVKAFFDRDWDAVKRSQRRSTSLGFIGGRGFCARFVKSFDDNRVDPRIDFFDPANQCFDRIPST